MADMDVETEIRDLKRRVGELEGSFSFLTSQVRGVHRDLIGFQEETRTFQESTKGYQVRTEKRLDRLEPVVTELKTDLKQLRAELPGIVGDVMREVLRETRR